MVFGEGSKAVPGVYVLRNGRLLRGTTRKRDSVEIRSMACACPVASDVPALQRKLAAGGAKVRFDGDTGEAIFRDRKAKLAAMKVLGLHDRDEVRG